MKSLHLIVTRFNLGMTDPVWLEHRFGLFERFTLPSIKAQTCQEFWWLHGDETHMITTRLGNDDAVSPRFAKRIKEEVRESAKRK